MKNIVEKLNVEQMDNETEKSQDETKVMVKEQSEAIYG